VVVLFSRLVMSIWPVVLKRVRPVFFNLRVRRGGEKESRIKGWENSSILARSGGWPVSETVRRMLAPIWAWVVVPEPIIRPWEWDWKRKVKQWSASGAVAGRRIFRTSSWVWPGLRGKVAGKSRSAFCREK